MRARSVHMIGLLAVATIAVAFFSIPAKASAPTFLRTWGTKGSESGQFLYPDHVAVSLKGYLYVADVNNNRIQKFTHDGKFVLSWGSQGSGDGQFKLPRGIAVDSDGNVYVADTGNSRIQKFDKKGKFLMKFGSSGSGQGQLSSPYGLTIDLRTGDIYVADSVNFRVQRFDRQGVFLTGWGSYGEGPNLFGFPTDIAVDENSLVYVMDAGNNAVAKYTADGTFVTSWGSRSRSSEADGDMFNAFAIDVDYLGGVYVVDLRHRVQKFNTDGVFQMKWGSYGTGDGQFNNLRGIAISRFGVITVTDNGNNRMQQFSDPSIAIAKPDFIPPKISLKGETPEVVIINGTYTDAGATALDDTDGDLTSTMEVVSTVDTSKIGSYKVTYTVVDESGNEADPVVRTVLVEPKVDPDPAFAKTQAGRILLQTQVRGQAWYIDPKTYTRHLLGTPGDAFRIMRLMGLGISNATLAKIPTSTQSSRASMALRRRLAGQIVLQVQSRGEAWYINPNDLKRYSLGRPAAALNVIRQTGIGITNTDLAKIVVDTSGE